MKDLSNEIKEKQAEIKELESRIKNIKAEIKDIVPRTVKEFVDVVPYDLAYYSLSDDFTDKVEINGKTYIVDNDLLNNDTYAEILVLTRRLLKNSPNEQRPRIKDLNRDQIKFLGEAINRIASTYNELWIDARKQGLA